VRRPGPWLLALLVLLPACHRFTKEGADEEVYGLLARQRRAVEPVRGTLDVEATAKLAEALRARRTFHLGLRDALELATVASRDYRRKREDVYLAALTLTSRINDFRPLWAGTDSSELAGNGDGSTVGSDAALTLSRAFERGGGLVISLAASFLRNLTGNPVDLAQTILNADLTLPLLRGSGELVAREDLTQAEHDVLYALRDFARYQQSFTVEVATRFYRTLQQRDAWQNAEARYQSLKLLVAEVRAKGAEGRLAPIEVDQVEQDLLASDDDRQRAHSNFDSSVDALKLDLGIPVTADVALDDRELEVLRHAGLVKAPFERSRALRLADRRRLDLLNARDQQADARRKVRVARDALRAGLDLKLGGDLKTPAARPLDLGHTTSSGTAGVDVDLPLERTAERNALRRAMIDAERARRDREQREDEVVLQVRDAYRTLAQAERSYQIQRKSTELAERRVDSTQELLALGLAQARDRLEAEGARLTARNALTGALVDHALALLTLELDVGTLRVDAHGGWTWFGQAAPAHGASGSAVRSAAVRSSDVGARGAGPAPAAPAASAPPSSPAGSGPAGLPPPVMPPRRAGTLEPR
jgi:outer membrane protein TolC